MVMPRAVIPQTSSIKAVRAGAAERPAQRFGAGRTCEAPGCATMLSAYNPRSVCWQHETRRPFVHQAPRRPTSQPDRRVLVLVTGTDETRTVEMARMPGPEPEPTGPPGPPPVPQPDPVPEPGGAHANVR
jgi:hypothetical protein